MAKGNTQKKAQNSALGFEAQLGASTSAGLLFPIKKFTCRNFVRNGMIYTAKKV
jgi:hypothetical protein